MKTGYDDFFSKAKVKSPGKSGARRSIPLDFSPLRSSDAKNSQAKKSQLSDAALREKLTSRSQAKAASSVEDLRERIKAKRVAQKIRLRGRTPWKLVIVSVFGIIATVAGMQFHEKLDHWVSQIEVGFGVQAQAEDSKTEGSQKPEAGKSATKPEDRAPAAVDGKAIKEESSAKAWNENDIDHFKKLVERKEQLDAREAELARLEAQLQSQKEELEKRMKTLEDTRTNISTILQDRATQDEKKVETLVQVYSNMKPAQAAKVLEAMDEDLAVDIVGRMKKKNAAEVLNLMKAEKAQAFSEKFAGYRK